MKYPVAVTVNGRLYTKEVEARTLLVDFLRDELGLTGTHVGCETSQCGACTVLCGGKTLKSCTRLAVQCDGDDITTLEGVASGQELGAVQAALLECRTTQCGFCLPGIVLLGKELLGRRPDASDDDIRRAFEGIVCRCTGYQGFVDAVRLAASGRSRGATGE